MVFYLFFELLNDLHLNAALCCWLVIERVVLVQVPKYKYYLVGWRLRSRSDLEVCIGRCLEILRVKNGWKRESDMPDATAFVFTHWKNISFSASTTLECLTSQLSRALKPYLNPLLVRWEGEVFEKNCYFWRKINE